MRKIIIFVDWFAPGYKGGGQIQSCVNLAIALQHEMEVLVVTTDRDLGSDSPYPDIKADEWNKFAERVRVLYLSPGNLGYKSIKAIITAEKPEVVYLNSMFSLHLTLLPLEVCRSLKIKVILAPRGMLHAGALQYKSLKKKLFFQVFKWRGFHRKITFHATDSTEEKDIRRVFGRQAHSIFVADFPSSSQPPLSLIEKNATELRCIFVSRISPKKNLSFLLELLLEVKGTVRLTIIGPAEDAGYWNDCQVIIKALPANVSVDYLGPKANNELSAHYQRNHLFVLPTFGENFGHVIFESLVNGRPVLISDLTPWRDLQSKKTGWDISLENKSGFLNAMETACSWNQEAFEDYCKASWQFASTIADTTELRKKYLELFQ